MAKIKSFEEAKDALVEQKNSLKENKAELKEFKKEHKLKGDKQPEGAKLEKQFGKLNHRVDKGITKVAELKELVKELKPAKDRQTKYEYPDGLDDKGKKKFRAAARRALKSAEKKEEKPKKKDKNKDKDGEED